MNFVYLFYLFIGATSGLIYAVDKVNDWLNEDIVWKSEEILSYFEIEKNEIKIHVETYIKNKGDKKVSFIPPKLSISTKPLQLMGDQPYKLDNYSPIRLEDTEKIELTFRGPLFHILDATSRKAEDLKVIYGKLLLKDNYDNKAEANLIIPKKSFDPLEGVTKELPEDISENSQEYIPECGVGAKIYKYMLKEKLKYPND